MQSLWGGDSVGRALVAGGRGLSIAVALSSLQLPELALPKCHRPIIGEQYLGKQSGTWKETLWVAGQACQTPSLASLVCTGRARNRCIGVVSNPPGQGGNQRVSHKVGSSCCSPRSTPALGECAYRGMCVWGMCTGYRDGNRVRCQNVKQSHWTDFPSMGCCKGVMGATASYLRPGKGWGFSAKSPGWVMPSLGKAPGRGSQSRTLLSRPSQDPFHFQSVASSSPHPWVGQGYRKPCLTLLPSTCHNTITLFFMPTWSVWLHPFPFPAVLSHELKTVTFQKPPLSSFTKRVLQETPRCAFLAFTSPALIYQELSPFFSFPSPPYKVNLQESTVSAWILFVSFCNLFYFPGDFSMRKNNKIK